MLIEPLRGLGIACRAGASGTTRPSTGPRYDLVVLRSPWDYAPRRDEFVAWAASVPRLANPAGVVDWNTDKRYLAELAAAGVTGGADRLGRPRRDVWRRRPPASG